jgi:cytoskeletal protein CcmA (bactofilin family)
MAWFKKPEDGDEPMMNSNASRPEPREPRAEPRTPSAVPPARPIDVKAPESRPAEPRAADPRVVEPRVSESRVPEPVHRASVLGATLRFRGELSAQEDLIVQGSVEGSITHTSSLTIGTDGSMKGDIRARVIVIDGRVEGDLYATESVNIRATAKVKGNVFAPRVGITEGAFFQGQVEMQPSGAAVQEHSARMRQAALAGTPPLESVAVDQMLSTGNG